MQDQSNTRYSIRYAPFYFAGNVCVTSTGEFHSPRSTPLNYLHYHNCLEIGYCYEGNGLFFIDDMIVPFSSGDASIIARDQIHIAQSSQDQPGKWRFVHLDTEQLISEFGINCIKIISSAMQSVKAVNNILTAKQYPHINKLVAEIIQETVNQEEEYLSVVKGLMLALLTRISRIKGVRKPQPVRNRKNLERVASALNFISENYMKNIDIDELSFLCNTSISNFRKLFISAVGHSPSEYLYSVRIKMACLLLRSPDLTILDVSLKVGYSTLSSFNRHFKRIMNVTPREWRRQEF